MHNVSEETFRIWSKTERQKVRMKSLITLLIGCFAYIDECLEVANSIGVY
jgi:hypothetical protein